MAAVWVLYVCSVGVDQAAMLGWRRCESCMSVALGCTKPSNVGSFCTGTSRYLHTVRLRSVVGCRITASGNSVCFWDNPSAPRDLLKRHVTCQDNTRLRVDDISGRDAGDRLLLQRSQGWTASSIWRRGPWEQHRAIKKRRRQRRKRWPCDPCSPRRGSFRWSEHSTDHVRRQGSSSWPGCLTSQQHVTVSQGRICSDSSTCCHAEKLQIKLSTSPSHSILTLGRPVSADLVKPGAWQGSRWSVNF